MSDNSKRPHKPSKTRRELVKIHAVVGTQQDKIARILEIDAKTLRKYYRNELDLAKVEAISKVGGALFNKCMEGDTASLIFWMKTQAGWKEQKEPETSSDVVSALAKAINNMPS